MKKLFFTSLLFVAFTVSKSQVIYYTGEWTKINNQSNFSAILRLEIKDTLVTANILWTFMAIDSSDAEALKYYKDKKGKFGIEYAHGKYSASSHDIMMQGEVKTDPDLIIGLDKYLLKWSLDKKVIYGKTYSNGDKDGLVYFIRSDDPAIGIQYKTQEIKLLSMIQEKAFIH